MSNLQEDFHSYVSRFKKTHANILWQALVLRRKSCDINGNQFHPKSLIYEENVWVFFQKTISIFWNILQKQKINSNFPEYSNLFSRMCENPDQILGMQRFTDSSVYCDKTLYYDIPIRNIRYTVRN